MSTPKQPNRLEIVDILKGFSMLTIVVYHYLQAATLPYPFNKFIAFGGTGIHLFFVLSGFGLYLSHQHKPQAFTDFLKRKFSKIYFPYIFVVLLTALLSLFWPLFENSWYALGGHLFFYKMFDNQIMGTYGYQFWFMSTLFQFYLLFFPLAWLLGNLSKTRFWVLSLLLSLGWMGFMLWSGQSENRVYNGFFMRYLWEFAAGMLLAIWYRQGHTLQQLNQKVLLAVMLLGLLLYGFAGFTGDPRLRIVNDFAALPAYSLLAILLFTHAPAWINKGFLRLGNLSFPLFMLHMLTLEITKYLFGTTPGYAALLGCLLLTLLLAEGYRHLLNRYYRAVGI